MEEKNCEVCGNRLKGTPAMLSWNGKDDWKPCRFCELVESRKPTMYHEAGHLVLALFNFWGEQSYDIPEYGYIHIENLRGGKVKGFSFYETVNNVIQFPTYAEIEGDSIKKLNLKKELIKYIGGIIMEIMECKAQLPSFTSIRSNKGNKEGWDDDIYKYKNGIRYLYNINMKNDYMEDFNSKSIEKSQEFFTYALDLVNQNIDKIRPAIEFVVAELKKSHVEGKGFIIQGEAFKILVLQICEMLKEEPQIILQEIVEVCEPKNISNLQIIIKNQNTKFRM